MPLDPQAQSLLSQMREMGVPATHTLPVAQAREDYNSTRGLSGEPEPIAKVEEHRLPDRAVTVRAYTPRDMGDAPLPVIFFFHGGGFVLGDLDLYDARCRTLADRTRALVVAVDYRLAPEHPFPTAPEDCYAATEWVARHAAELGCDTSRLAVMGDSAGGTLAAVVAQTARDRGGPALVYQVLIYPNTDATMGSSSMSENDDVGPLTREDFVWFYDRYLPSHADRIQPLASPLHATNFESLPPALIVTGEFDPLRDEGEAYARKLREAGVPVTLHRYDGMIHGFFMMPTALDAGKIVMDEVAAALRDAFDNQRA